MIYGDNNIQAGGDVNIGEKTVIRNQVVREPGEISDRQAKTIKDLIAKLSEINKDAGRDDESGGWHKKLWNRYHCTSYKKLRVEDYDDAVSWLKQEVAKARPKLRRTNNRAWRNEHYTGIYAKWRSLGREKDEIYSVAEERLGLKKPIKSLKDLGERNLKKLHGIVMRMN